MPRFPRRISRRPLSGAGELAVVAQGKWQRANAPSSRSGVLLFVAVLEPESAAVGVGVVAERGVFPERAAALADQTPDPPLAAVCRDPYLIRHANLRGLAGDGSVLAGWAVRVGGRARGRSPPRFISGIPKRGRDVRTRPRNSPWPQTSARRHKDARPGPAPGGCPRSP